MAPRDKADQREASKLLVDVAKVAITLSAGAIAVDGAFLRDLGSSEAAFWFFLGSIVAFIGSIAFALTAVTRTIERAGGGRDRRGAAWHYQHESGLLQIASLLGAVGIVVFVVGTVFA